MASQDSKLTCISIIGRPNVGKSSLFNTLLGERKAVVLEESGTTRDRAESVVRIKNKRFRLVDTGGFTSADGDELSKKVKEQIFLAINDAAILILVVDVKTGIVAMDKDILFTARKSGKPIILVVNKVDNINLENNTAEFYEMGLGHPVAISCLHKRGIKDLEKRIVKYGSSVSGITPETVNPPLKIAIIGRPNVGKSSFINFILKKNRVIVSDKPGTTRDSIDTFFSYENDDYILIDTAGIRHKRKLKEVVDAFSVMRSERAITRADTVILMVDAKDGITKDDSHILDFVEKSGKACQILINKWDLAREVKDVSKEDYIKVLIKLNPRFNSYPINFISAKTGENVLKSLWNSRVLNSNLDISLTTPYLNKLIKERDPAKIPIPRNDQRPNFLYMTQTGTRPIEFTIFVNRINSVKPAHLDFIENLLRENAESLKGIPFKLRIKSKGKRT